MDLQPLDFEKPIVELERRLRDLKEHSRAHDVDLDSEIEAIEAKLRETRRKPLLFVDIDGVLSLWGFGMDGWPTDGGWHQIDGVSHFLSARAARHPVARARAHRGS